MAELPIILIVGPTAGGKTALAVYLANHLPGGGVCLSADSMQIYREMNIGTAKPTPAEQAAAPHELIDLVDPNEVGFTVDTWLEMAEARFAHHRAAGRWPIVVGGTNLYIQALLEGLYDGPAPDDAIRTRLQAMTPEALRQRLLEVDPASGDRIHANDRKRTIRAVEVFELTGTPLTDLQREWHRGEVRSDVIIIGLDWPVERINRRINARVKDMMAQGLLEETRRLHDADRLGVQAREALGYKQLLDHLEGRCSREEAVEQIKIRTRRFAKQQRTWLRRVPTHPRSVWLEAPEEDPHDLHRAALDSCTSLTQADTRG